MAKVLGISTAVAGAVFALASSMNAEAGEFDGVTVNIMTQTGAIQEPLQRRAPEFEKLTGAKINVIAVPFSDLYQKVLTDWASGTNSVDAAVFAPSGWSTTCPAATLRTSGRASPRTKDQVGRDRPVLPQFLGDLRRQHLPRSARWRLPHALLQYGHLDKAGLKPPKTWDEYLEVAKALNSKDEVDGTKGYGSCIAKKRNAQSYWFITDVPPR